MSFLVHDDVIRFQVSVDVVHAVHCLDSQNHFSSIKPTFLLCKDVLLNQQSHEISSGQELHDQIEVQFILERELELHYPWAFGVGEDLSLPFDVSNLLLLQHLRLSHFLHRHNLPCLSDSADSHLSKCPFTNDVQELKVLNRDLLPPISTLFAL